jgi:hypothetical protein
MGRDLLRYLLRVAVRCSCGRREAKRLPATRYLHPVGAMFHGHWSQPIARRTAAVVAEPSAYREAERRWLRRDPRARDIKPLPELITGEQDLCAGGAPGLGGLIFSAENKSTLRLGGNCSRSSEGRESER